MTCLLNWLNRQTAECIQSERKWYSILNLISMKLRETDPHKAEKLAILLTDMGNKDKQHPFIVQQQYFADISSIFRIQLYIYTFIYTCPLRQECGFLIFKQHRNRHAVFWTVFINLYETYPTICVQSIVQWQYIDCWIVCVCCIVYQRKIPVCWKSAVWF